MPSSDPERVLTVIAHNIGLARSFVHGLPFEEFAEDERTLYAVTRCLEIISETSRRLPNELKMRHPQVPWAQIAAAGNFYRHDYDGVVAKLVWNTVQERLDSLDQAVQFERS